MTSLSRRAALAGMTAGGALAASGPARAQVPSPVPVPVLVPGGACVLAPQAEEGPFYLDRKLLRAEIREGRPGVR